MTPPTYRMVSREEVEAAYNTLHAEGYFTKAEVVERLLQEREMAVTVAVRRVLELLPPIPSFTPESIEKGVRGEITNLLSRLGGEES